ncbi:MAG: SPFH domain-containing protein [Phycisphaerales bacterium]
MAWLPVIVGGALALAILSLIPRIKDAAVRVAIFVVAVGAFGVGVVFSSLHYVPADRVGIVDNKVFGDEMEPGQVIALDGQIGTRARVLTPGWHVGYWPVFYSVDNVPLVSVGENEIGLVKAVDGAPLRPDQVFADEMPTDRFERLLANPVQFLSEAGGQKGPQTNVLLPGKHRVNTELFDVTLVPQLDVKAGTVAVLKSNVGAEPSVPLVDIEDGDQTQFLALDGEKGVRAHALAPGKYPINPKAFELYTVSTKRRVANYTLREHEDKPTFGEIPVKSSDGYTFPVDVRVVYYIKSDDAPRVVALLGGDNMKMQELLTSRVRSIFRDNAESVKALDYVKQRTKQAQAATRMLHTAMAPYGITIESIDIGEVGNEETLGELLQTQRDREIAIQQQLTYQDQQRAAEQEKALNRTQQEALEEKRLATARYAVQIAEQERERRVIEAEAEAEAIRIQAQAQALAYAEIREQIGAGNAALMEMLARIGEHKISITPRVMVNTGASQPTMGGNAETVALIGTMLDSMVRDAEDNDSE